MDARRSIGFRKRGGRSRSKQKRKRSFLEDDSRDKRTIVYLNYVETDGRANVFTRT